MRSYALSFGWCTGHYQAMYDIDEKYTTKLTAKLEEINKNLKENIDKKKERYCIVDAAAVEAAKIIAQYSNLQCVIAEVPPSYAIVNGGKLKQAMQNSETLSNPVSTLIAINSLMNMNVKNKDIDSQHLERAKGATQLYAIGILLDQIDENKNKPEFAQNKKLIESLTNSVKQSLCKIYGENIFDRMKEFGEMGKDPSYEQKNNALEFLIEVDAKAKSITSPENFQENLQLLINKQNEDEGRTIDPKILYEKNITIKVQYPDHDHSLAHMHGIPHTHEHTEENKYQEILDKMHSEKHTHMHPHTHTHTQTEEKTKENLNIKQQ